MSDIPFDQRKFVINMCKENQVLYLCLYYWHLSMGFWAADSVLYISFEFEPCWIHNASEHKRLKSLMSFCFSSLWPDDAGKYICTKTAWVKCFPWIWRLNETIGKPQIDVYALKILLSSISYTFAEGNGIVTVQS